MARQLKSCSFQPQSVYSLRWFWVSWVVLITGCVTPPAEDVPLSWRDIGPLRPSRSQIQRARSTVDKSLPALQRQLQLPNTFRRRRAAYILEQLGTDAAPTATALRDAFVNEDDPVTRGFIMRAIAATGDTSPNSISLLRKTFYQSDEPVLHAYAAGAVIRLNGLSDSQDELQVLLDCLNPREELAGIDERLRWEICWAAAYMATKLGDDARPLVPALESLSEADNLPPWVRKQVWFTLRRAAHRR